MSRTGRIFAGVCVLAACAAAGFSASVTEPPLSERIYLGSRPSLSKDGKTFVFEWADTIWKASTEGGVAVALQTDTSKNIWPVLSPNGDKVAFCSDRDGGDKIFEVDINGEHVRQVTFHSESSTPYQWINGGRDLLALVGTCVSPIGFSRRIAQIPADRRGEPKLYFDDWGSEPSLSPDGKQLLFTRKGSDLYRKGTHSSLSSQVWLYDCESKQFTALVKRDTESRTPLWMPDGKGFYYVSGADGCMNIWKYDLKKKSEQQITFFTDDSVIHPTLSGNGKVMVFRKGFDFYRIDPRSPDKNPKKIILTPNIPTRRPPTRRRFYEAAWNNDYDGSVAFCDNGMQIAFTAGGDLFVMDTVIRNPHVVQGDSRTHERECLFSKDGKTLFYLSDRGDGIDLWKAERADAGLQWWENFSFIKRQLTHDDIRRENLKMSADGTRLSWQDPLGRIHICDLEGKEVALGPVAADAGDYAWSPDGKWMVAAIEDPYANSDIWIFPIDGSRPPYNLSRCFKYDRDPCWSPDGKLIAFVGSRPDTDQFNIFYVWLNPEDEAREGITKKHESARKAVSDNKSDVDAGNAAVPEGSSVAEQTDTPKEFVEKLLKATDQAQPKPPAAGEKKPEEKKAEEKKSEPPKKDIVIDFNDLYKRVRRVRQGGLAPYFSHDSRTLAYRANGGTFRIRIPDNLNPEKISGLTGNIVDWVKKGDRILWKTDNVPAHFNTKFPFKASQVTDLAAYQELIFMTAWGRLRDGFYDGGFHGADWNQVKEKYRYAARYAPCYSVFNRVIQMMLGELNASHLGFYATPDYRSEWERGGSFQSWSITTVHLGVLFDPEHVGQGWKVQRVIPGSPADQSAANLKPGDLILAVDGHPVAAGQDVSEVLNRFGTQDVVLTVQTGDAAPRTLPIRTSTYSDIRKLMKKAYSDELRERVHRMSDGRLGYLDIAAMDMASYYQFEEEIFSEGYGHDGMIIDVRDNSGGFVADRILQVLCGSSHSLAAFRDSPPAYLCGYWGRPVWDKPIVVLCNETTASNGEIFTHAIKTLKRGRVVGVTTGARVIATNDRPLLDYGKLRMPSRGWFLMDGRDMEKYGAEPDVIVEEDPNQTVQGVDVQLNAAIKALLEDVEQRKREHPPVELKYFR